MTNEEEKTEINYAYDIPTDKDYTFDEFFNSIDKDELQWINSKRPENTKIWNQDNSPACTCYSITHIINANNIIEDQKLWENREQVDPMTYWKQFCAERNDYDSWSSIQTLALHFKNKWRIEWYVTIDKKDPNKVDNMKKALNAWYFLSTGSAIGDWSTIKKTGIYSERSDEKFVWHWRGIVDREDDYFRAVNSYWDKRWPYNWRFKVPFSMVDKIYSCLVIIDKDDAWRFTDLKIRKKVEELITIAKELYNNGNAYQKKYFNNIMLSKNLKQLYNM